MIDYSFNADPLKALETILTVNSSVQVNKANCLTTQEVSLMAYIILNGESCFKGPERKRLLQHFNIGTATLSSHLAHILAKGMIAKENGEYKLIAFHKSLGILMTKIRDTPATTLNPVLITLSINVNGDN